jgi:hypothetical protein
MRIVQLGSCRVVVLDLHSESKNIAGITTYPHCTKEIIQLIKFLKGEIEIPYPYNIYCFRTAIISRDPEFIHEHVNVTLTDEMRKTFNEADMFVIEVSTNKVYEHNGYYLHHITVDGRGQDSKYANLTKQNHPDIYENTLRRYQELEEIEKDLLQIREMLGVGKRMTVVFHFDGKIDGKYLQRRHWLVEELNRICFKNSIEYFNPACVLDEHVQDDIIKKDLTHYTDFGNEIISKTLLKFI